MLVFRVPDVSANGLLPMWNTKTAVITPLIILISPKIKLPISGFTEDFDL